MKIKKSIFLIAVVHFLMSFGLHAQVPIGTGTDQNQAVPFEPNYNYGYAQTIYLAEEINAQGSITSLEWYFSGETNLANQNITVYIGHTPKSSFATISDWVLPTNLTEVHTGSLNIGEGWFTIDFNTPFAYNGTDNLVIAVKEDVDGADSHNDNFYNTAVFNNRSLAYYSDSNIVDVDNLPEGSRLMAFVPNIIFNGITASCQVPTNASISEITFDTAVLSWDEPLDASAGIQYFISENATQPSASTQPTGSVTSGTTADLTSLASGSVHYFWIRSNCDSDGFSAWTSQDFFKTECEPATSFNENFDEVTVPELPNCWTTIFRGPTISSGSTIQTTPWMVIDSEPNSVLFYNSVSNTDSGDDIILVSPILSNIGSGTHRLKFTAKDVGVNGFLQVVTLDTNTLDSSYDLVEEIQVSTEAEEYIIDFSNYDQENNYIGIKMTSPGIGSSIYVDNIVWEANPACADVTELHIPVISTNEATVTWIANGGENNWQIAFGENATDPEALTPLDTDNTTILINELDPATNYTVWVRSSCESSFGGWIGPVTFTTNCEAVASFNENFDAVTAPVLPGCWTKILRGETLNPSATIQTSTNQVFSAPNSVQFGTGSTNTATDDVILVSPTLNNLGNGTHRLRFQAQSGFNVPIEIGTMSGTAQVSDFTVYETVVPNLTMAEYIVTFSSNSGMTDTHIGIRIDGVGTNYAFLDNIIWEAIPACADVSGIEVTDITANGATINWNSGEGETEWQVAYGAVSITDPETLTPVTATQNPTTPITGLSTATKYNLWVRSVCEAGNGLWIGPVTFTTECLATTTLNENFDSVTTPALPDCWSRILRGETLAPSATVGTMESTIQSGPNVTWIFKANSGANADHILITPKLSNINAGTHLLKFYSLVTNASQTQLQIGTLDGNNPGTAVFTTFQTIDLTSTTQLYTVDFSNYEGTDTYIGFRMNAGNAQYLAILLDNITWDVPAPECAAVADIDENFDATDLDTLPNCWTEIIRGPSTEISLDGIMVKAFEAGSVPNAVNIFKGFSTTEDEQILVLPQVTNLNAGTHKLSLDMAGPPVEIEVGTMNSNTADGVFTPKETLAVPVEFSTFEVDFTNYTGTDTYIALRLVPGEAAFVSMYIDNIIWANQLDTGTFNSNTFAYYPNPVKDILNLSYDKNITKVAVYNVLGQEIMVRNTASNQSQIDMSSLASETYLVKVTADNAEKTIKVIKQ
ncbi:arginine repressor [Flavobacterium arsenatis]|uniref:Arginine repressor n=1 Tax=Flavobacterium arsenatis TaxID=1484332 RepID=A0ABU1TLM1_9FLAO|nr:choice-of-anchor J domain-containing protein [Flavobacterium arsenatis]MDR6966717.1 arginine repressor [Flavobacterium arsenatis]